MTAVGIAVFNKALRGAEVAMMGNRKKGLCRKVMKRTRGGERQQFRRPEGGYESFI